LFYFCHVSTDLKFDICFKKTHVVNYKSVIIVQM
jgi:hypothetical protein